MYCGDETGAVVMDVGHWSSRFGYGGEDFPKLDMPTHVGVLDQRQPWMKEMERRMGNTQSAGNALSSWKRDHKSDSNTEYFLGEESLSRHRPGMSVVSPLEDGMVRDWDLMEAVWSYGLDKIHADPTEHPILYSEPVITVPSQREKSMEIFFESLGAPAVFPVKSGTLHAFSVGRPTALVVDVGSAHTRVCPVYDGYCLETGMLQSFVGGFVLSQYMQIQMKRSLERGELSVEGANGNKTTPSNLQDLLAPTMDVSADVRQSANTIYNNGSKEFPSEWFSVLCGGGTVSRLHHGPHTVKSGDPASQLRIRERLVDNFGTTMSFQTYKQLRVAEDIKRAVCRVTLSHYTGVDRKPSEGGKGASSEQNKSRKEEEDEDMEGEGSSEEQSEDSEEDSDSESTGSSDDEEKQITYDLPFQRGRLSLAHEAKLVGELLFDPSPARPMDWQTSNAVAQEMRRSRSQQAPSSGSSGAQNQAQQSSGKESSQQNPASSSRSGAQGEQNVSEDANMGKALKSSIRARVARAIAAGESPMCVEDDMDLGIDFCRAAAVVNDSLTPSERVSARQALRNHGRIPREYTSPTRTSMFPDPLQDIVHRSLMYSDPDIRKTLVNNIILVGGGSRANGLKERLYKELDQNLPSAYKPRVLTPGPLAQQYSAWIGGSILSTLGTFQQMWISKQEFEEEGPNILNRRSL
eukprot:gb/GECG01008305.1/.p1 GENE.gb/GECG01008305.1/~~gb/GECG01008305.1/.p1  ORF type:complete len:691 (+),score=99.61 gb/GECG01008305.1/:1-2073(+)